MKISLTVTGERLVALRARALSIARRFGEARRPAPEKRPAQARVPGPPGASPADDPPGQTSRPSA